VVSFKQNQQQTYIIAASAGTGGNISPSGNISITSGGSQTFTFTPLSSYEVDQVLIDGANNPSAVVAGSYTFSNVTANHSIVVSFKQNQQQTYIITASAGSGGNISPSGNVFVNAGGSQTFTFSPLFSYEIDQVLIDGANNPSAVVAGSYTFSNVTANHSIAVSFKQNQPQTYIIAASAESGGNISPNGNIFITSGGSQTFTFSPLFSYEIDQVLIDGANNASAVSARYYTFSNVTANHSIAVSFKQKQDFSGGSGTQQNPYLISSRADMERLATNVNGGQNYSGVYFGLTRDLTGVNDVTTTVVGKSYSHYFSGIFDGSGHTLKVNLYGAAGSEAYVGVFGYTNGATIKNLGVGGDIIQLENTGVAYVGGICGRAENTVISNCYNTGNISSSASSNGSYSGGICGLASAYNSSMSISDCYNAGNISAAASSDAVASYHSWSGGICGYVADNGSISISDCYNTGNISVAASSGESSSGGICGYVSQHSSISNCYNTGNIYSSSSHSWSGGICGYGSGNIQNCFVANCQIKAATSTRISDRGIYNCYADKNITLNGVTASSNDANSRDGKDATLANFQTQSWIQANLQWNFQTEWEMSNMNDPVHKGLPILRGIDNGVGIPVVRPNESVLVDVFPNPAKNELFFTSDHSIEKVEIYTQSGILALTDKAPGGKIDVSRLAAGVYFVRVYVNGGVEIRKVIVGG
jgi:hypothetical protein